MNVIELRAGAHVQAAIAAGVAGWLLSDVPPTARQKIWPYGVFCCAFLAVIGPYLLGHIDEDELSPVYAGMRAVLVGVPFSLAARWLSHTPYPLLSLLCWGIVALSVLFFSFCVVRALTRPRGPAPEGR